MPITFSCDVCNTPYTLKDEFAGRKLRCQKCQTVLLVPEPEVRGVGNTAPAWVDRGYHPAFDRDRFLVNQKRIAVSEKYYVFDDNQTPILFIERPAKLLRQLLAIAGSVAFFLVVGLGTAIVVAMLEDQFQGSPAAAIAALIGMPLTLIGTIAVAIVLSPRRHITVYSDDTRSEPLVEVLQDQKFNVIRATYTVKTPDGVTLGVMMKNYLYNLFRKRWYVLSPEHEIRHVAREDSMILSLLRRLLGPFFGLLRTNFIIQPWGEERVIGEFNRKLTLFDRYVLDLSADREHQLDRRLGVALGVLLDTGERR